MAQTCIVHLIRNSLAFLSWKERKAILPAIKAIYRAENADTWRCCGSRNSRPQGASAIRRSGRCGAGRGSIVPFFAFAPSIRKMIYTTNAVEARSIARRARLSSSAAASQTMIALKLVYLAIKNAGLRWWRGVA